MQAFEEALMADDRSIVDYPPSGSSIPGSPVVSQPTGTARIRKVSAMSDFAPVNIKVKRFVSVILELLCSSSETTPNRRRRGTGSHDKKQEWLFILLRWPLLVRTRHPLIYFMPLGYADRMQFLIALFIAFEFGCYVAIRQVVNAKEWLSACQSDQL